MKIQIPRGKDTIFVDKPAGLATHSPDLGKTGLSEWLEEQLQQKLWVVHRLDKTTTGAIVFATTALRADELRIQFELHQVKKVYWFLTDRASNADETAIESFIEKQGNRFVSVRRGSANSKTRFKRIKRSPFFELWQAEPETGKPHQVRLHAADAGLPILGDEVYGGSNFPHLCLHAQSLQLADEEIFQTPAPRFFERLGVLKDPQLVEILASLDRRQRLFQFLKSPNDCIRLIHNEIPELRLDKLGPILWLHWYKPLPPSERDFERWDFVRTLLKSPLMIQQRLDRGQNPNSQSFWALGEAREQWIALENGVQYQMRREQGLSAGLFLDQRLNRQQLAHLAPQKSVLNLFSYTSGFSLNAALAGASQITTVDLSAKFLEWSKENFVLNGLDPMKFEWSAADSFIYLKGAVKRNRKWDLIVCDPPSFSRSGKNVFRLKDDLEDLLKLCFECLAPRGRLLFSTNMESLDAEEIESRIRKCLKGFTVTRGRQDLDFELPNESTHLKSFWIHQA